MIAAAAFLVVAVALLEDSGARRVGAAGAVGILLALAAARVSPGSAPSAYLTVNTGLLLLGTALSGAAPGAVLLHARRTARTPSAAVWTAALAGAIGLVLAARAILADLSRVGPLGAAGAAIAAALIAVATAGIAGRLPLAADRRRLEPGLPAPGWLAVLVATTILMGWGGTIPIIVGAGALTGWAAWLAVPRAARRLPIAAGLATLLLAACLWLFLAIRGPEGLALSALHWLPISPAAERLLGLLLFGGVWCLSGLWPAHQPRDGVLTAPAGTLLLARLALPAVPAGLVHWQPLVFPLVLLGMWHAALTRRVTALATGGALLGAVSLDPAGLRGAGWLLACAVGLDLAGGRRLAPGLRALLALGGAWGALGVLTGGLRAEVVYTVLAAAAAASGLARAPRSPGASALTPPPGGSILPPDTVSP